MKKILFILPSLCLILAACDKNTHYGADAAHKDKFDLSAGDQSETEADRGISQKIREAVLADPALSSEAKNIVIITRNGVITFHGKVRSDRERSEILKKAQAIAGARGIDNKLEVSE